MSVTIQDRHVVCPECHAVFEVARKRGGGADYAKTWNRLTKDCSDIILLWLSHYPGKKFTKSALRVSLAAHAKEIKEDPMNARVSELLGLGLVSIAEPESRSTEQQTDKAPVYQLDIDKAAKILNQGGRLK